MYPWLRLGRVLGAAPLRPPLPPLGESVVAFRVWPTDLDQNRHMNNGRYLQVMDLGRFDLVSRTGMMKVLVKRRWYPVVHSATIRFRKALDAFQEYELRTRVVGWDERGFYLEQRFVRHGTTYAVALVKGVFLGPDGRVRPADLAREMGTEPVSPPLPAEVRAWQEALDALAATDAPPPKT